MPKVSHKTLKQRVSTPRFALVMLLMRCSVMLWPGLLIASSAIAPTEIVIRSVLGGTSQPGVELWDLSRWREPLLRLYERRAFSPLWFDARGLRPSGLELIQELRDAESRGLNADDYDGNHLAALAAAYAKDQTAVPEQVAALDVALSVSAARIAVDLHAGRVAPTELGYDLDIPHAQLDAGAIVGFLAAAPDIHEALNDLEPNLRHYDLLKASLARYRAAQHELKDGALLVQKIALSLERARWLPTLQSPPIIVNIPQFKLFAFRTTQDRADEILQMDVIVGSDFPGRHTPVFAADMSFVVLNPYWNVPYAILKEELLPLIRADRSWVERNGYEIVRGESDEAPSFAPTDQNLELLRRGVLRLRQTPGALNAVGRVKFMLPNRHNVYLHDTPAKALFRRSRRDFSHGCIRLADPMGLLAHVLRDQPEWTTKRINNALSNGRPVRIPLLRPVRVFILYGTALAKEDGETLFFEDVYRHDAVLSRLLMTRRERARTHP